MSPGVRLGNAPNLNPPETSNFEGFDSAREEKIAGTKLFRAVRGVSRDRLRLRDSVKEPVLRKLAHASGYYERTLRRYLPLRAYPNRRIIRVMTEAFESVAFSIGSLVSA